MIHEKIIKDARGTITIKVELITFGLYGHDKQGNKFRYDVVVYVKAPKKRNEVIDEQIVTPEEIQTAKEELWQLLKPR